MLPASHFVSHQQLFSVFFSPLSALGPLIPIDWFPKVDFDCQNSYGRKSSSPEVALLHWLVHPHVRILIGEGEPDGLGRNLTSEEAWWVALFSPGLTLLLKLDLVGRGEAGPSAELQQLLKMSLAACKVLNDQPTDRIQHPETKPRAPTTLHVEVKSRKPAILDPTLYTPTPEPALIPTPFSPKRCRPPTRQRSPRVWRTSKTLLRGSGD